MSFQELPPITPEIAIRGLQDIFDDLQTRFHDQWDWMNAHFYVEVLRCTVEDQRAASPSTSKESEKSPRLDVNHE